MGVAVLTVCSIAGAVDAPSVSGAEDDGWTLPAWTANDQPIRGTFANAANVSVDDVRIRYRLNDGDAVDVKSVDVEAEGNTLAFTLPEQAYEAYGFIHIWAEAAATGEPIAGARSIALADWHEFDITGQTDVELLFPMQSWAMQVRFTPCCLILGGYLRVERIPINPTPSSDGLPDVLASEFLHLAPDPTVVATSGLNGDITIDPESAFADSPDDVTVYTWFKGRWMPVRDAELHAETNTIRFKAIEGGFFVLGPKPGVQS